MWYPTTRQRYGKTSKGCLQDNSIKQATYHSRKLYNFLLSKQIGCKVDSAVILSNPYSEYRGPEEKYCPVLLINELITYIKMDDTVEEIVDKQMSDRISDLLLESHEQFSKQHYGNYSKKVLVNA